MMFAILQNPKLVEVSNFEQRLPGFSNKFINAPMGRRFDDVSRGRLQERTLSDRSVVQRGRLLHGENMPLPAIVIAQHDPSIAQRLAHELHPHFARVAVTRDAMELHRLLLRHEARVAVLDLELVNLDEVHRLASTFDDLTIVCTHQSPDERMWMAALNAGAAEFCHSQDVRSILRASRVAMKRRMEAGS